FVGSTIVYAFMQAVGMVNDHVTSCFRWGAISSLPAPPTSEKPPRRRSGP
ncbi:MAG: DNA-3-methyladenine glycosylase I, partial [Acidithiobacillales bacterium]